MVEPHPCDPNAKSTVKDVKVSFEAKEDNSIKHEWNSGNMNTGKLVDKVMSSRKISDTTKLGIAKGRTAASVIAWKRRALRGRAPDKARPREVLR